MNSPVEPGRPALEAFEFAAPGRILFGAGGIARAGKLARELGQRAFVVMGANPARAEPLLAALRAESVGLLCHRVPVEPTTDRVREGATAARAHGADLVIGLGGGSVLDAAKAIAALATNDGDPLDYLEGFGRNRPLPRAGLPVMAIPTTAGTGSEATRNAVIASPEHRAKASIRHLSLLPRIALVDPSLTLDLPPELTAATGLDALTQLIEPMTSLRANPMVDALCRQGIPRVARSLVRAWRDGRDTDARADMCLASLWSGLALANAALGIVHGFAGVLGGRTSAPHGAICAALLPHAMAANIRVLGARTPDHPALACYREIARLLTGKPSATAEDGVEWVGGLVTTLRIPALGKWGVRPDEIPEIVALAATTGGAKANPARLTPEEMSALLSAAL
jgi:alcohol dehydrogenase class IV